MGLFSWLRRKQKEVETPDNFGDNPLHTEYAAFDPAMPDGDRTGMIPQKPAFKVKAILSGTTLTVFLPNGGNVIVSNHGDHEMLQKVVKATSEREVRQIMLDEETPQEIKRELQSALQDPEVLEAVPEFLETGEFEKKEGNLFLKGINLPIPKVLAKEILKAGKEEGPEYYDALKNFWCWCAANPDARAREDLFEFLEDGDFKITKRGFFIGFRNVDLKQGARKEDKKLVEFISAKYVNIKTKQKKSPKNYSVIKLKGEYEVIKNTEIPNLVKEANVLDNLADLYANLSTLEENVYTDQHSHTMTIKIGEPVRMARESCDADPNSSCSRGLHIKNKNHGGNYGSTSLVCIVNPMNVVAVPRHDTSKLRCCEYFPLGVVEGDYRDWLEDASTLELEDEYVSMEVDNLMELAKEGGVPNTLIQQVAKTIGEYQKEIEKRVVKV